MDKPYRFQGIKFQKPEEEEFPKKVETIYDLKREVQSFKDKLQDLVSEDKYDKIVENEQFIDEALIGALSNLEEALTLINGKVDV